MAKQMVMAGLKWPPEVGAQVMMAKAIPMVKAHPTWKREPYAVTPTSESRFRVKEAMAAMPGKLTEEVS